MLRTTVHSFAGVAPTAIARIRFIIISLLYAAFVVVVIE